MNWVDWLIEWIKGAGWLEQGTWCEELCGVLMDSTASGGPLYDLKQQTGRAYPDLEAKRQNCVNTWIAWRDNEWWQIWETPELSGAYKRACQIFAVALDAAQAPGIAGVSDWLKKYWPYLLGSGIVITSIGIACWKYKK